MICRRNLNSGKMLRQASIPEYCILPSSPYPLLCSASRLLSLVQRAVAGAVRAGTICPGPFYPCLATPLRENQPRVGFGDRRALDARDAGGPLGLTAHTIPTSATGCRRSTASHSIACRFSTRESDWRSRVRFDRRTKRPFRREAVEISGYEIHQKTQYSVFT